mmetsp:Transcript_2889/g.7046  ORF Transcript_2889/g.7046 Transcript_2889/m.7046 type:complete len:214 (-) Transcript_2889:486-1127(-)
MVPSSIFPPRFICFKRVKFLSSSGIFPCIPQLLAIISSKSIECATESGMSPETGFPEMITDRSDLLPSKILSKLPEMSFPSAFNSSNQGIPEKLSMTPSSRLLVMSILRKEVLRQVGRGPENWLLARSIVCMYMVASFSDPDRLFSETSRCWRDRNSTNAFGRGPVKRLFSRLQYSILDKRAKSSGTSPSNWLPPMWTWFSGLMSKKLAGMVP